MERMVVEWGGGVKMKALMIYEMGREIRGAGVGGCGRR